MNNHIVKADNSKPFHTSGYAVVANGNRVGAVSTMTFAQRQQIENNRQKIAGYGFSAMGRSNGAVQAGPVASGPRPITSQRPVGITPVPPRPTYNPYE